MENGRNQIEADRLRDEVIRRMANTPPKPKGESSPKRKRGENESFDLTAAKAVKRLQSHLKRGGKED